MGKGVSDLGMFFFKDFLIVEHVAGSHFWYRLDGDFKYFLCSTLPGEMIQFDEHSFQMG